MCLVGYGLLEYVSPTLMRVSNETSAQVECRLAGVQKSSFSFSGFSNPLPTQSSSPAANNLSSSSGSPHCAAFPEVPVEFPTTVSEVELDRACRRRDGWSFVWGHHFDVAVTSVFRASCYWVIIMSYRFRANPHYHHCVGFHLCNTCLYSLPMLPHIVVLTSVFLPFSTFYWTVALGSVSYPEENQFKCRPRISSPTSSTGSLTSTTFGFGGFNGTSGGKTLNPLGFCFPFIWLWEYWVAEIIPQSLLFVLFGQPLLDPPKP